MVASRIGAELQPNVNLIQAFDIFLPRQKTNWLDFCICRILFTYLKKFPIKKTFNLSVFSSISLDEKTPKTTLEPS